MRKQILLLLGMLSTVALLTFTGCKKEKEEVDNDTSAASENAMADAAFTDVANIADEAATGSLTSYRTSSNERVLTSCATITIDSISVPRTITIDFGSSNCLGNDGNYRRGIILVSYSGQYRDSGSTHTISFNNYYVNDNQVLGTKSVTNNGRNAAGNLSFTIAVNGSIVWDASFGGGTSTHVASRSREWIAGENTQVRNDDIYLISGTASGVTRTGKSYTMNTLTPCRKRIGFRHFSQGIIEFTPSGKPTRSVDYGYINGAEDNLAMVTINGNSFAITLR